jgi:hypothetical protein
MSQTRVKSSWSAWKRDVTTINFLCYYSRDFPFFLFLFRLHLMFVLPLPSFFRFALFLDCFLLKQKVLERPNLTTFPVAMVAIVTLAKDCVWCTITQQLNNTKPLLCKAEKSCLELTALYLKHFKTVEDIGLKLLLRDPPEWYYLRTKFHENLSNDSKVISGTHTHTHTQTGDLTRKSG